LLPKISQSIRWNRNRIGLIKYHLPAKRLVIGKG
jgi:hypothetical protein